MCGDEEGFFYTFQAEIMHGLFGPNNWHSAGGADQQTFLTIPASAGITTQAPGTSAAPCGWDRWMLEWEHPDKDQTDNVFISTGDGASETNGDISIENLPNGGTFVLRDNYFTGDAVRIKLPHINWQIAGDIKNQYLWLENHQHLSEFDQEKYNDDCKTQSTGLYISLQAGKDIKIGTDSEVYSSATMSPAMPNSIGSWMMPISAEGNYDFEISTETPPYGLCEWGNGSLVINMDNNIPNPFTGFSDLYKVIDGGDGVLGSLAGVNDDLVIGRFKRYGASVEHELYDFGDDLDAFTLSGNNTISIATNPSSVSVYTYISNVYNINYPENKVLWENDTIWLNGLMIEITAETTNTTIGGKDMTVDISWDNYSVDQDVRWCGNIVLQNDINDPLVRQSKIILEEGKIIKLEKGLSPTQHKESATMSGLTEPTTLTLKDGTKTTLKKNSCLLVHENSTLLIKSGAELILEEGAQLHALNGGKIVLESGATIKATHSGAKILIEEDGVLVMEGNDIQLNNPSAKIELKGGGTIETADNVDFTFTGTGHLVYYADGIFDLGTNSRFYLKGTGKTDMKCWLQKDADLYISTRDMWLEDCKIVYDNGSLMRNAYANFYAENVLFNTGGSSAVNGISAYDTETFYITQATFDGFHTPIKLENISVCPDDVNVEIRQSTFQNYTTQSIQAIDVDRMYLYANSIEGNANATTGIWLEDVVECKVEAGNIKNHTYQPGVILYNTRYFILDGATVKNNYRGIESYRSNIYLRNLATIKLNTTEGIYATSSIDGITDPNVLCKIVVGDIGCGWIIQNATGILGVDILLDIDAVTHAINEGDEEQPNRFDGNTTQAIEVCYDYFDDTYISNTLMAKGNYWTGSAAPSGSDVSTGFNANCNDITTDASAYVTTQPTNCDGTNYIDLEDEEALSLRMNTNSCNYLINEQGGGRISIAEKYQEAYQLFLANDFNLAYQKFNWIKNRVEAEYPQGLPDGICKHLYGMAYWYKDQMADIAEVHCQYPFYERLIEDNTEIPQFTVYPNPADNVVTIGCTEIGIAHYTIMNATGSMITQGNFEGSTQVQIEQFPSGIYFIQLHTEKTKQTLKLVIE